MRKLSVKVGFVFETLNFIDELVPNFVTDVQRLELLANLQFEEVVCFLDFHDVHLLQLKHKDLNYLGHLQKPVEKHFFLVVIQFQHRDEEKLAPEHTGVRNHLVDQVKTTEIGSAVYLDARS